jgi:hypothetical protein
MNDSGAMGPLETFGNLDSVLECLVEGQRTSLQPLGKGLSLDILQDEVVDFALAPHVVERTDARMVELGDGSRLPMEALLPLSALGILGEAFRQNLDRHGPVQADVPRFVDVSHASRADLLEDLVMRERAADQGFSSFTTSMTQMSPVSSSHRK